MLQPRIQSLKRNLTWGRESLVLKATSTSPSHSVGTHEQQNVTDYFRECPLRAAPHFSGFKCRHAWKWFANIMWCCHFPLHICSLGQESTYYLDNWSLSPPLKLPSTQLPEHANEPKLALLAWWTLLSLLGCWEVPWGGEAWRGAFSCPIYPTASSLASQHLLFDTPQQCLVCDPCAPTKVFNGFLSFVVKIQSGDMLLLPSDILALE